ncbi:sulfite exporter TauE/SafE family protein [Paludisphaera soli]|uniref:sulfite exporter TauE/SafE family protein n=1 Tax=Paludisphaera soli TaxID=2712865 RepID=UPI00198112A5|nr:sulfite exporter TauE/SafE family protein [Paludisphaera soli]
MFALIDGLLAFAPSAAAFVEAQALVALAFGGLVGFSLGLTGGGGSIFAVPLLVYGLGVRPREAIGVSLAAVGANALVGGLRRLSRGEVEVRTGLLFTAAGMVGAPAGSWLGSRVPEGVLLVLFAGLMVAVAARMWRQASRNPEETRAVRGPSIDPGDGRGPSCRRDPEGRPTLTSRCFAVLLVAGLVTGVLSGLFGVGGGFVIVPALVLVAGMGIHRAVATSLLVIALIGASGVASHLAAGRPLPLTLTLLFVAGGVAGMELGSLAGRRLAGPRLQKLFASAMIAVAAFIVLKSLA